MLLMSPSNCNNKYVQDLLVSQTRAVMLSTPSTSQNLVVAMAAEGQGSTQTPGALTLPSMMPWRTMWTCFPFSNRTFCLYLLLAILGTKTLIPQLLHRPLPRTAFLSVRASQNDFSGIAFWRHLRMPCYTIPNLLQVHSGNMLVFVMLTKALSFDELHNH